jgi:glutamine synthetase
MMSPPTARSDTANPPALDERVRQVVVHFVDNGGIARCKTIRPNRWDSAIRNGLGASPTFGVFQGNDRIAACDGLDSPVGDLRLHPDPASIVVAGGLAYSAGELFDQEGNPWALCARGFLRRMVCDAAQLGLALRMAYELEWYAATRDGHGPANDGPAYGLAALARSGSYLWDIADALDDSPIRVEQIHPEYGAGQLEVSIAATDPLSAADQAVVLRQVIRSFDGPEVRASFSPLPMEGASGNGCHLHVSIERDGTNLFGSGAGPTRMSEESELFLAGVLAELPALVGLACASPVSYLRIGPRRWTGSTTCWGVENREAPLRMILGSHQSRPHGANVELKVPDGTSNPYLVAGAVIAAGLHGIRSRTPLSPAVDVDPASLSEADRDARGLRPLPADMLAGAAALERSEVLAAALGADLLRAVVAVRRGEAADHADSARGDIIDEYRWRY